VANIYVRSTDGNNADNGSTWALAKADLTGAAAIDAAGDVIYLSQAHSESTAGALTIALAGTSASPTKVIGGNDAAEPPTAVSTAPKVVATGTNSITITGGGIYFYGVQFEAGSGSSSTLFLNLGNSNSSDVEFEACAFRLVTTGGGSTIALGTGFSLFKNCTFKFAAAGQSADAKGQVVVSGGSLESGGTSPTNMFSMNSSAARLFVEGFDLSNASSGVNIFKPTAAPARALIRNSKLPASWSGSLVNGTLQAGERYEMHNCDATDTNYRMAISDYAGSAITETTIVRTGGANDGTTSLSWKLVSTANAEYPNITFDTAEIVQWNDTTGSSKTCTVEIITDNVTLTDAECWLEIQYLGTSGFPLGSFVSDSKADVLATAANQATSTETWTTTLLDTPVKQKLVATFTPQEKGFVHAVVRLAKASTTVYVDPKLTIA
jgi:hypothetical protein